jgi:xylulokinase
MTAVPLFDFKGWDAALAEAAGTATDALPDIVSGSDAVGRITGTDVLLGGGGIDAFGEQLVAGADGPGDVLVICGTTLITWAVIPEWVEVPGLWTIPHTAPGRILIGGPSNAGGLFLNWASGLAAARGTDGDDRVVDPDDVPVWLPYVRGERTPLHDPDRRASLHGLDLTHGAAALRRAAYEAAGFVVRHHLDLAGVDARRIVATGGGVRVDEWVQCLADCTGLPVDIVAVPEGGALGAAFMARLTAGLESQATDASRWVRIGRRVEPDRRWQRAAADRYARFRALTASGE